MISKTNVQDTLTRAPAARVPVSDSITESEFAAVCFALIPGFRPDARGRFRGAATDRGGDNQQALSIDLRRGLWFDHVTGEGGDIVTFVKRAHSVDFRGAVRIIETIIGRSLIDPRGPKPAVPRFTREDLARAELFRAGLIWRIERELQEAKARLWSDDHEAAAAKTRTLTATLESALAWNSYEAAAAMKQTAAGLAGECVAEAREAQTLLAHVIAAASARVAA